MIGAVRTWLALAALSGLAWAQSFNIDVGEAGSEPPPAYAAAGVAGFWNSVRADHVTPFTPGPTPQDVMLVDIHGNQTGVGFHQFGGMDLVTDDDPGVSGNAGLLLEDHLATHSLTLEDCMYLNGLQDGTYEVLTYAWMPNSPSTLQQVRFDFVPGSSLIGGAWSGNHVEGVTYSRDVVQVTNGFLGFHVGIPSGGTTFPGAAFNGVQLRQIGASVPLLSPAEVALMAVAAVLIGVWLLRRA